MKGLYQLSSKERSIPTMFRRKEYTNYVQKEVVYQLCSDERIIPTQFKRKEYTNYAQKEGAYQLSEGSSIHGLSTWFYLRRFLHVTH